MFAMPPVQPGTAEMPLLWVGNEMLSQVDFTEPDPFCAPLDVGGGVVVFLLITKAEGLTRTYAFKASPGRAVEQVRALSNKAMFSQVDKLPIDPWEWPEYIEAYRYTPVLTAGGRLSQNTPNGFEGEIFNIPTPLAVSFIAASRGFNLEEVAVRSVTPHASGYRVSVVNNKGVELSLTLQKGSSLYYSNSNGVLEKQVGRTIWVGYNQESMRVENTYYPTRN